MDFCNLPREKFYLEMDKHVVLLETTNERQLPYRS